MSFLKFFVYYIASFLLLQTILIGLYSIKIISQRKKLKKDIASGKVKMITIDEALEKLGHEDKKTWN